MNTKETALVDLERVIYAASGLMENAVLPLFGSMSLDGQLKEIQREELCETREQAALCWMEDNYDTLLSALYAVSALVEILNP